MLSPSRAACFIVAFSVLASAAEPNASAPLTGCTHGICGQEVEPDVANLLHVAKVSTSAVALGTQDNPSTVPLGGAGDFAILSKTGVTDVSPSEVWGDVGSSPITGAAILLVCSELKTAAGAASSKIRTVDVTGPSPCSTQDATGLSTAVADMATAYINAVGKNPRANGANAALTDTEYVDLYAGNIGGNTFKRGIYKWTSPVWINADIKLDGLATDFFIFQIAQTLIVAPSKNVGLLTAARAHNVFWQVAGAVTLGNDSHFEGNILGATSIAVKTSASINGRLLAQTAVTLEMNIVKRP
jgi:hypothetical protein